MTPSFHLHRGTEPLLLSLPHVGTALPDSLKERLVDRAWAVEDTDWHLEAVYAFALEIGASVLVPVHSRYWIDLNRPPEDTPMYPGVNNTALVPTTFFTGEPLYRPGQEPNAAEVAQRIETGWRPYHAALEAELARLRECHGRAVLWEGHSIRSELPWLFPGRLPDLNLGTVRGASCSPSLRARLMAALASQKRYTHVTDGRFQGGYNTRHYGRPDAGLHAVQMEMVWSTYMAEEPPWTFDGARAAPVQALLRQLLGICVDWARSPP